MAKADVLLVLSVLFAAVAAVPYLPIGSDGALDETAALEAFETFKKQFGKSFSDLKEESTRFSIFKSNLALIAAHNADYKAGKTSFWMEINHLADLTDAEYRKMLGFRHSKNRYTISSGSCTHTNLLPNATADWRNGGAVTEVKDQGQCGSCWTFSATGAIEGAWYLSSKQLLSLSEEEILQCDFGAGTEDKGCDGGDMDSAFNWVISNDGIATEEEYPYVSGSSGLTGKCLAKKLKLKEAKISAVCDVIAGDEKDLEKAVSQQPVAVGIEADQKSFQFYGGGILPAHKCGVKLDHGVLAVGYGYDAKHDMDYWIVKNSWGNVWGEEGYIRMQKFPKVGNHSACGIDLAASYPLV